MFSAGRVLLMPKGAYNPLTTYEMLDIVSYNGSSYIAKGTTTGNLPTDGTYWQLSAYGGQAANIAGNFAELESSSVATATHYVDDIFVDENSQLMKATQTINIGDTIDENVNCTPTTVEALISYLSSYVDSLDSLNKKIQGAIEIAAQTDLHSLAIGEYYKKQSTFYVTNGPTGIDQDPTAIFRLTVEAALDNASQASSPLLLTLRTPDGKIYTQGFDGTSWGSWEQIAVESSVADVDTRVDSVESSVADVETSSTASKSYAVGESFYYNDVLLKATSPIPRGGTITPGTNCTPEKIIEKIDDLVSENQTLTNKVSDISDEIADMNNILGAKNLLPFPYYTISKTERGITWTVNSDGSISASGTATADSYFRLTQDSDLSIYNNTILSGCPANGGMWSKWALYLTGNKDGQSITKLDEGSGVLIEDIPSGYSGGLYAKVVNGQTVNFTFKPMIRLASIQDDTYEPYSMTNREMTPYVQAISNPNLLDNPWFTVNQRGYTTDSGNGKYPADRWQFVYNPNGCTITRNGNQLIVDNTQSGARYAYFFQLIDDTSMVGKMLTGSVLLSDGTILSGSGVMTPLDDAGNTVNLIIDTTRKFRMYLQHATTGSRGYPAFAFEFQANCSLTIVAVKLELGSVSTLAQDTAPNYQQELAKCQRYFYRHKGAYEYVGYFNTATNFRANLALPVPMRAIPSMTLETPTDYAQCAIYDAQGSLVQPSAIAVDTVNSIVGQPEILLNSTVATHTQNICGVQRFNLQMDLSADL